MDEEREPDSPKRTPGGWLWLVGAVLTAAAFYWALPAGHGRPTSMTVFGINPPEATAATYPGLRPPTPVQSQLAAANTLR